MLKLGGGHIVRPETLPSKHCGGSDAPVEVTVASVLSYLGVANLSSYAASKSAAMSTHEALDMELAQRHALSSAVPFSRLTVTLEQEEQNPNDIGLPGVHPNVSVQLPERSKWDAKFHRAAHQRARCSESDHRCR